MKQELLNRNNPLNPAVRVCVCVFDTLIWRYATLICAL